MNRKALAPYITRSLSVSGSSQLTDLNGIIQFTGSSAQNFTVMADASVNLPIGAEITVLQDGTGSVTITPDTGVTLLSNNGGTQLVGQYSAVTLVKKSANNWYIFGATLDPFQIQRVRITGTVVNNNATANTIADITGLAFPVTSGLLYWFRFFIRYNSAATTTGARFSITGPATPTLLNFRSDYTLTATSRTFNDGLTAYDTPAASNASALTTGNIATIEGIIQPSANGNVTARFASEIASSAITVQPQSFVEYRRIA
ncbi:MULTISPECIES: hypothetical protein [unclassified Paraflavitalea]|uniref:hypothetical protein n=1 Tax=unclassified Paraflavitalea TaxID=2798305 RepID=UPI003D34D059